MLSDRPYLRSGYARESTSVVTWMLCAVLAGFVVQNVFGAWLRSNAIETMFALSLAGVHRGYLWTFVTYTLLHANILHLFLNGLGLYLFGRELAPLLGNARLAAVALASAVAGGLAWAATHYFTGGGAMLLGASSCVTAFFIIYACFNPDREITFLVLFVLPVTLRPRVLAWIIIGFDLLGYLFSELPGRGGLLDSNIAHSAHLGGALAGWIYFRYFHANRGWDRAPALTIELPAWLRRKTKNVRQTLAQKVNLSRDTDMRAEVDRILDKINSQGFGALTEEEKRRLDEAKDMLSRR